MPRKAPIIRAKQGKALRGHDPATTLIQPLEEEFLEKRKAKIVSADTRRVYRLAYRLFRQHLASQGLPDTLESFTADVLEGYRDDLAERPSRGRSGYGRAGKMSRFTASAYLRPLGTLASWLAFEGWLERNPFDDTYDPIIPSVDRHDRILKIATMEDVVALLAVTSGDDEYSLRDRAFVALDWGTGGRTSELCRLRTSDLKTGSILTILGAKGDRDREAGFDEFAEAALGAYLENGRRKFAERMRMRSGASTDLVFISDSAGTKRAAAADGRLTPSGILQMLTRRWHQAGGSGSYGAHRFRHGLGTLLAERGVALNMIAAQLGHASTWVTEMYLHPRAVCVQRLTGAIVMEQYRAAGLWPNGEAA